jgi:hypothetical protein
MALASTETPAALDQNPATADGQVHRFDFEPTESRNCNSVPASIGIATYSFID